MMLCNNKLFSSIVVGASSLASYQASAQQSSCTIVESIKCLPVSSPPTLDGKIDDWSSVETVEAPLTGALTAAPYPHGPAKIGCVYDTNKVYFLYQIPGLYRFDATDNHKCASISSMFKIGMDASLYNMGGCPLALEDCPSDSTECDEYKVDIGGHWELKTTEQGVYYATNEDTGDDVVANKDDEYAVSPLCRMDDDDALAANEWEGAWSYVDGNDVSDIGRTDSNSDEVVVGSYVFEMARSLTTISDETDAQLEAGKDIDYGFSFWDPYESLSSDSEADANSGWTDAGHYVTGCSRDWISLRLVNEDETAEDSYDSEIGEAPAPVVTTANVAASYGSSTSAYGLVALVLATTMM